MKPKGSVNICILEFLLVYLILFKESNISKIPRIPSIHDQKVFKFIEIGKFIKSILKLLLRQRNNIFVVTFLQVEEGEPLSQNIRDLAIHQVLIAVRETQYLKYFFPLLFFISKCQVLIFDSDSAPRNAPANSSPSPF